MPGLCDDANLARIRGDVVLKRALLTRIWVNRDVRVYSLKRSAAGKFRGKGQDRPSSESCLVRAS